MQVELITPEKTLYSAEAVMVTIPGSEGEFGVLDGHAPFISTLRPGIVRIDLEDGKQKKIAVADGFAEALPERCTILAETALDCEGITAADAKSRFDEAKQAFDAAENDLAQAHAAKKMALAEVLTGSVL